MIQLEHEEFNIKQLKKLLLRKYSEIISLDTVLRYCIAMSVNILWQQSFVFNFKDGQEAK